MFCHDAPQRLSRGDVPMSTTRSLLGVISAFVLGTACHTSDTWEDVWPDPRDRTLVGMRAMHLPITTYWSVHQTMPPDADLRAASRTQGIVVHSDPWGTPLRYVPFDQAYCNWSAGPDTLFGTDDDFGIRGEVLGEDLTMEELSGADLSTHCALPGPDEGG